MQMKMTHPQKGEKLVFLDDIDAHKEQDWVEYDPEAVQVREDSEPVAKKRGRPFKVSQ